MTTAATPAGSAPDRTPESGTLPAAGARRALTVGLVLTVSVAAFEALAVATVMPVAARELHGIRLYGWTFSAFMLANLVGVVVAGPACDRQGIARPFAAGLSLFGVGLLIGGAAPSMVVLVLGRAVQGLGAGAISSVAYVCISRGYPEAARPRMMALLSSAWVIPGLIGPWLAGLAADHLSWRVVFFALVVTLPVAAALALPAMRKVSGSRVSGSTVSAGGAAGEGQAGDLTKVGLAVRLAAGAGLLVTGLGASNPFAGAVGVVAGGMLAVPALRRLMPAGTGRARPGLPAAVAVRGLMTFSFFGTEAFVTLALTNVRGHSAAAAGAVLTGATLSWSLAAWIQARLATRWSRRSIVTVGMGCILAGAGAVTTVLVGSLPAPVVIAAVAWCVAGFGMGLAYPTISLAVLAGAEPGREGEATSSMQIADVLGIAMGTGLGGAAIALVTQLGGTRTAGIAAAFALTIGVGAVGLLASRRLDPSRPGAPAIAMPSGPPVPEPS